MGEQKVFFLLVRWFVCVFPHVECTFHYILLAVLNFIGSQLNWMGILCGNAIRCFDWVAAATVVVAMSVLVSKVHLHIDWVYEKKKKSFKYQTAFDKNNWRAKEIESLKQRDTNWSKTLTQFNQRHSIYCSVVLIGMAWLISKCATLVNHESTMGSVQKFQTKSTSHCAPINYVPDLTNHAKRCSIHVSSV